MAFDGSLSRPLVGIATGLIHNPVHAVPAHGIGDRYIQAVRSGAGADPFLIPVLGEGHDADALAARLDGLFLPGGRANIEPHHYGGPAFPEDEIRDRDRDYTVLPLIRACVELGVPIFGVCRGLQEINVAMGGSLHYRVHLVEGKIDHRMPKHDDIEVKFGLRHMVSLNPDGMFDTLVEVSEVKVNSAHGQGIDRLAEGFVVEALAPDGIIEGIRAVNAKTFTVGVQWHAEWGYDRHDLAQALFQRFGDAARERRSARLGSYGLT
jgi:putative glutamine amidotransferase